MAVEGYTKAMFAQAEADGVYGLAHKDLVGQVPGGVRCLCRAGSIGNQCDMELVNRCRWVWLCEAAGGMVCTTKPGSAECAVCGRRA